MSSCKPSPERSEIVLDITNSSFSFRVTRVFAIIVLIVCGLFAPASGQHDQPACGKRQQINGFLVHSASEARLGDWPWHATIYAAVERKFRVICGGTIIGKNAILTAANCLFLNDRPLSENDVSVHAGRVDVTDFNSALQAFVVSKFIIHPEFTRVKYENDIAIIKLSSDIVPTPFVRPVCLWSMGDEQSQIVGKNGIIVGFGLKEYDQPSKFLHETALTVVDNRDCLEQDRLAYGRVKTSNMFCAVELQGANACNGDNGGGMVIYMGDTWYVRGIMSFIAKRANGSCESFRYAVFTDVSKYSTWISQSIDTPSTLTDVGKLPEPILRSTNIPKLETHLQSCMDHAIRNDTMCNYATFFDSGFLLVYEVKNIIRVPLDGGRSFRVIKNSVVGGINQDCYKGRFYWSDIEQERIYSANYDGSDLKPFIKKDISWPRGVAVDWISRRLYWADKAKSTIEVASLDNPEVRTVLISTDLVEPHGMTVDVFRNKLYWLDPYPNESKIEWSNLDGTEREVLLASPRIRFPLSIHLWNATGEICYSDDFKRIECIDPISKKIRTIASNLTHALGLGISEERFYWNNQLEKRIESINMDGVRQKPITSPLFEGNLYEMTLVSDKCPIFYSPCAVNNGECPENTICLMKPSAPSGKICKCTRDCKEN